MSVSLSDMRELRKPSAPAPVLSEQREIRIVRPFVRKTRRYVARRGSWLAVVGTCLQPFLQEGDAVFVDPTVEAREGDLVCAMLSYVLEKRVSVYGPTPDRDVYVPTKIARRESIKVLRIVEGVRWLVTVSDGAQRLDDLIDAEIVGVVTGWHRWKWWRRPAMRKLRRLRP